MGGGGLSVPGLQLHHQSGKPDINAPGRKTRIRGGHDDGLFGKAGHDLEEGQSWLSLPVVRAGESSVARATELLPKRASAVGSGPAIGHSGTGPCRRQGPAARWKVWART